MQRDAGIYLTVVRPLVQSGALERLSEPLANITGGAEPDLSHANWPDRQAKLTLAKQTPASP